MKRMDKAVLPYSLHCCESSRSSAIGELKDMLKAAASPAEAAIIECVGSPQFVLRFRYGITCSRCKQPKARQPWQAPGDCSVMCMLLG